MIQIELWSTGAFTEYPRILSLKLLNTIYCHEESCFVHQLVGIVIRHKL